MWIEVFPRWPKSERTLPEGPYSIDKKPTRWIRDSFKKRLWRFLGYVLIRPLLRSYRKAQSHTSLAGPWIKVYEGTPLEKRLRFNLVSLISHWVFYKPVRWMYQKSLFNRYHARGWRVLFLPLWYVSNWFESLYNCPLCNYESWLDSQNDPFWFELIDSRTYSTQDGTFYDFWGWATCPRCNSIHFVQDGT